jgi:DNA-binding transcriptional ArsR family regulator
MLESLRRFKASIFRALGHPIRVGVVEYLRYGEQSVERLCEKLRCDEATLVPHLAALTKAALVVSREAGGRTVYAIRDQAFVKVLETMREYYFSHLTEAMRLLKQEEEEMRKE